MEEYIRLEEEKSRRHGKVYNWKTAKYSKICTLNNNEIDFRISFDESDDEDYTVIFDKNSFSYKIIYVNDLKTDSENDNEKVNMPLFPSPELTVSCFDDLDFFKDFENEFPAIVYNDALPSKSNFLTEPTLSPQHIDEFDLKDETSLSEYDEVEQNILYFNDLFPFNIIYPDDLKSDKDNDDNKIDIIQSSGDMALPPRYQRHQYLRFEGLQYTDADIINFETRMLMEHRDAKGHGELVRLQICEELNDTWAWVAQRPERQPGVAAGAPEIAEGAPDVVKGDQVILAPVQAPQPPPAARTISQRDFSRFTVWVAGGISQLFDSAGATYIRYSKTHVPYQRCRVSQYGVFQFMDTAYWSLDLAAKKLTKLVKYRSSGILCGL
ncbi:hypothetical protein Tco_0089913 [Tanacetum coccineum]